MNIYLTFSDGAKFADIARNLTEGKGYGEKFSFWASYIYHLIKLALFPSFSIPPVMPISIAFFFKVLGVGDFAVIATSFFYFLLTLIFVFLLARKVFSTQGGPASGWKSNLVGMLSTFAVGFNYDLINYATSGASESPFVFEIVAASYFISLRKKWGTVVAFIMLILMYFTRPQAFIYIAGLILFYLLDRLRIKKTIFCFLGIILLGIWVDGNILPQFTGSSFLYSVTVRGSGAISQYSSGEAVSDALRGSTTSSGMPPIIISASIAPLLLMVKKVFYNLYNFFKLIPQIMSPYLFALFAIGIFKWGKDKTQNSFKAVTIFMVLLTFLVAAASIPFFRYIHPVVPLVYILAVGTLVEILDLGFKNYDLGISKQKLLILTSTFLILFFGVGQTLGVLLLDSRFEANTHNVGKPPVYVVLSQVLKANTNPDQVVITNLDTWGSWYGERKTVWFPLEPKQLIDSSTGKIPFDAIYLTSYLIDDENYYMGANWRLIFNNPTDPKKWTCDGCQEISKEYILKGIYTIPSAGDYERQDATSVLLVKK